MSEPIRFRVTRASNSDDTQRPCHEAVPEVAVFTCNYTLEEFTRITGCSSVFTAGSQYRVVADELGIPTGAERDVEITNWYVTLSTLSELLAFMERHGRVVIDNGCDGLSIEIYDAYE